MSAVEQPRENFNTRESIIPRTPQTPIQGDIIQEVEPPIGKGPPPPPPPPPPPTGFFYDKPKKDDMSMVTKSSKAAGIAPPQGNLAAKDALIEEIDDRCHNPP